MIFLAAFTSNQFQLNWAIAERWEDILTTIVMLTEKLSLLVK